MIFPDNGPIPARISLLDYLGQHGWKIARDSGREEVAGLCPLHRDSRPSFFVNRRKQVFYCHGCGRGGGLARLRQLLEGASFEAGESVLTPGQLLEETYSFYQRQLPRSAEASAYLARRGIQDRAVIERMRIGYAPGACLRGHLMRLGCRRPAILDRGLIDERGRDCFFRCLTFPLEHAANLYGRAIGDGACRHRFLPQSKGGLYGWAQARIFPAILVVEGLLDLAAVWQAGYVNAVAVMGLHLNGVQLSELEGATGHTIYLCFDADPNGSGQRAAGALSACLRQAGVEALRVELPCGRDPNSLLASGGVRDFQRCLDQARP